MARGSDELGPDFAWLWRAYAVSALGTWLALDAFPLIAILVLHVSAAQVSLIPATSGAVGALLAVPLGPWIEFRSKRRLMIRADLIRFLALLTVPAAYELGMLSYLHLLAVAVVVAVADIVFVGASGAHLKALVPRPRLLTANGRFESVTWISTAIGPPLGGALIGAVGPVVTVVLNAVSFLLSAAGIRSIASPEPAPPRPAGPHNPAGRPGGSRWADVTDGWRAIAADRTLRMLLANAMLVNGLIMATAPLLAYLMLHDLGFTPFQYGLCFGVPCLGGIAGARIGPLLVHRFGRRRILLGFGVARALWLGWLSFLGPGLAGIPLVIAVEGGMIICMAVFNPVLATTRLERTADHRTARVLTAWTITSRATIAVTTVAWGLLASLTSPRIAIATAGVLMLAGCGLLPWRSDDDPGRDAVPALTAPAASWPA